MSTIKYRVVVVSPNSWLKDESTGRCSEIIERECDHEHRTLSGARKCLTKLYANNPKTGEHSAAWHRAQIRHADYTTLSQSEDDALMDLEYPLR